MLFLAYAVLPAGCYDVAGGAAELSWSLFDYDGRSIEECADADVAQMRLCWEAVGDEPLAQSCRTGHRTFDCGDASGVTGFVLPPGRTAFWAVPVCEDGSAAEPGSYLAPAPIVRQVEDGEVVTLSSLAIVVSDNAVASPRCGPVDICTCQE